MKFLLYLLLYSAFWWCAVRGSAGSAAKFSKGESEHRSLERTGENISGESMGAAGYGDVKDVRTLPESSRRSFDTSEGFVLWDSLGEFIEATLRKSQERKNKSARGEGEAFKAKADMASSSDSLLSKPLSKNTKSYDAQQSNSSLDDTRSRASVSADSMEKREEAKKGQQQTRETEAVLEYKAGTDFPSENGEDIGQRASLNGDTAANGPAQNTESPERKFDRVDRHKSEQERAEEVVMHKIDTFPTLDEFKEALQQEEMERRNRKQNQGRRDTTNGGQSTQKRLQDIRTKDEGAKETTLTKATVGGPSQDKPQKVHGEEGTNDSRRIHSPNAQAADVDGSSSVSGYARKNNVAEKGSLQSGPEPATTASAGQQAGDGHSHSFSGNKAQTLNGASEEAVKSARVSSTSGADGVRAVCASIANEKVPVGIEEVKCEDKSNFEDLSEHSDHAGSQKQREAHDVGRCTTEQGAGGGKKDEENEKGEELRRERRTETASAMSGQVREEGGERPGGATDVRRNCGGAVSGRQCSETGVSDETNSATAAEPARDKLSQGGGHREVEQQYTNLEGADTSSEHPQLARGDEREEEDARKGISRADRETPTESVRGRAAATGEQGTTLHTKSESKSSQGKVVDEANVQHSEGFDDRVPNVENNVYHEHSQAKADNVGYKVKVNAKEEEEVEEAEEEEEDKQEKEVKQEEKEEEEEDGAEVREEDHLQRYNYAATGAGAVLLASPKGTKGAKNLLEADKDKYMLSPCQDKKWVVIGLSEDIEVESVVLSNYEKYSSPVKDFEVLGSFEYPASEWIRLGSFTAASAQGDQEFRFTNRRQVRYLKVRFLSHYGQEFYCTLSQIRVYGWTITQVLSQELQAEHGGLRHEEEYHSDSLSDAHEGYDVPALTEQESESRDSHINLDQAHSKEVSQGEFREEAQQGGQQEQEQKQGEEQEQPQQRPETGRRNSDEESYKERGAGSADQELEEFGGLEYTNEVKQGVTSAQDHHDLMELDKREGHSGGKAHEARVGCDDCYGEEGQSIKWEGEDEAKKGNDTHEQDQPEEGQLRRIHQQGQQEGSEEGRKEEQRLEQLQQQNRQQEVGRGGCNARVGLDGKQEESIVGEDRHSRANTLGLGGDTKGRGDNSNLKRNSGVEDDGHTSSDALAGGDSQCHTADAALVHRKKEGGQGPEAVLTGDARGILKTPLEPTSAPLREEGEDVEDAACVTQLLPPEEQVEPEEETLGEGGARGSASRGEVEIEKQREKESGKEREEREEREGRNERDKEKKGSEDGASEAKKTDASTTGDVVEGVKFQGSSVEAPPERAVDPERPSVCVANQHGVNTHSCSQRLSSCSSEQELDSWAAEGGKERERGGTTSVVSGRLHRTALSSDAAGETVRGRAREIEGQDTRLERDEALLHWMKTNSSIQNQVKRVFASASMEQTGDEHDLSTELHKQSETERSEGPEKGSFGSTCAQGIQNPCQTETKDIARQQCAVSYPEESFFRLLRRDNGNVCELQVSSCTVPRNLVLEEEVGSECTAQDKEEKVDANGGENQQLLSTKTIGQEAKKENMNEQTLLHMPEKDQNEGKTIREGREGLDRQGETERVNAEAAGEGEEEEEEGEKKTTERGNESHGNNEKDKQQAKRNLSESPSSVETHSGDDSQTLNYRQTHTVASPHITNEASQKPTRLSSETRKSVCGEDEQCTEGLEEVSSTSRSLGGENPSEEASEAASTEPAPASAKYVWSGLVAKIAEGLFANAGDADAKNTQKEGENAWEKREASTTGDCAPLEQVRRTEETVSNYREGPGGANTQANEEQARERDNAAARCAQKIRTKTENGAIRRQASEVSMRAAATTQTDVGANGGHKVIQTAEEENRVPQDLDRAIGGRNGREHGVSGQDIPNGKFGTTTRPNNENNSETPNNQNTNHQTNIHNKHDDSNKSKAELSRDRTQIISRQTDRPTPAGVSKPDNSNGERDASRAKDARSTPVNNNDNTNTKYDKNKYSNSDNSTNRRSTGTGSSGSSSDTNVPKSSSNRNSKNNSDNTNNNNNNNTHNNNNNNDNNNKNNNNSGNNGKSSVNGRSHVRSGSKGSSGGLDGIYRTLSKKIKALEYNISIHDRYLTNITSRYQIKLTELQTAEIVAKEKLEHLETLIARQSEEFDESQLKNERLLLAAVEEIQALQEEMSSLKSWVTILQPVSWAMSVIVSVIIGVCVQGRANNRHGESKSTKEKNTGRGQGKNGGDCRLEKEFRGETSDSTHDRDKGLTPDSTAVKSTFRLQSRISPPMKVKQECSHPSPTRAEKDAGTTDFCVERTDLGWLSRIHSSEEEENDEEGGVCADETAWEERLRRKIEEEERQPMPGRQKSPQETMSKSERRRKMSTSRGSQNRCRNNQVGTAKSSRKKNANNRTGVLKGADLVKRETSAQHGAERSAALSTADEGANLSTRRNWWAQFTRAG